MNKYGIKYFIGTEGLTNITNLDNTINAKVLSESIETLFKVNGGIVSIDEILESQRAHSILDNSIKIDDVKRFLKTYYEESSNELVQTDSLVKTELGEKDVMKKKDETQTWTDFIEELTITPEELVDAEELFSVLNQFKKVKKDELGLYLIAVFKRTTYGESLDDVPTIGDETINITSETNIVKSKGRKNGSLDLRVHKDGREYYVTDNHGNAFPSSDKQIKGTVAFTKEDLYRLIMTTDVHIVNIRFMHSHNEQYWNIGGLRNYQIIGNILSKLTGKENADVFGGISYSLLV